MADAKTSEMFPQAIGLHQRGQLSEAEKFYRDILKLRPDAFEARHYLGVLRSQQGRTEEALALIDAVVAKHSDYAESHYNRGNILAVAQRYAEALSQAMSARWRSSLITPRPMPTVATHS
jgi:tetratricopeptide (TPR) repeat protein